MKRIIFLLAVLLTANGMMAGRTLTIEFKNGKHLQGEYVSMNDTAMFFLDKQGESFTIPIKDVYYVLSEDNKMFCPVNGHLVLDSSPEGMSYLSLVSQELKESILQVRAELRDADEKRMADPNYAFAKGVKKSGAVAMAVGIPSTLAGCVLLIAGYSGTITIENAVRKANCQLAGFVLLPFGASLTVVGVPLYVHGKKRMEFDLNYTGNGAGVALKW